MYAIENHSGEKNPYDINSEKGLFSALLILLDVIDTIGIIGITRGIAWVYKDSIPLFPKKTEEMVRINELLDFPEKRNEEDKKNNKNSVAQHLVDNYTFCKNIFTDLVKGVELGDNFKKEIEEKLSLTENFIKGLIKEGNN